MLPYKAWRYCIVAMIAICTGTVGYAEADDVNETFTLAELIAGEDIIVGDKRFHSFIYNEAQGNLPPENIAVTGVIDDVLQDGELVPGYGLLFSGNFTAGGLSGPTVYEAGLSFSVEVLNDLYLISDVHLDGTTFVEGTGDARITENFGGINVPSLSIRDLRVDDEILVSRSSDDILFSDFLDIVGFQQITVLKDIRIEAGPNTPIDVAEITTFRQLFTQTVIPEPTTMTMAIVFGIGTFLGRRNSLLRPPRHS